MDFIMLIWEQNKQSPAFLISLVSLFISFILFLIKIWEVFWKDRVKLSTTYFLTSERDAENEVIIANTSPLPVQVACWDLAWEPRWFCFWLDRIDVSPEETYYFKISGHDVYNISYEFRWGYKVAGGRRLILRLRLFGRKRQIKLVVKTGEGLNWVSQIKIPFRR